MIRVLVSSSQVTITSKDVTDTDTHFDSKKHPENPMSPWPDHTMQVFTHATNLVAVYMIYTSS